MRSWDARTMLYNTLYDCKIMLDNNSNTKDIVEVLEKKIAFLKKPPVGNNIRW